jgi:hypothetical protein
VWRKLPSKGLQDIYIHRLVILVSKKDEIGDSYKMLVAKCKRRELARPRQRIILK